MNNYYLIIAVMAALCLSVASQVPGPGTVEPDTDQTSSEPVAATTPNIKNPDGTEPIIPSVGPRVVDPGALDQATSEQMIVKLVSKISKDQMPFVHALGEFEVAKAKVLGATGSDATWRRSEDNSLDFRKDHELMLTKLTDSIHLRQSVDETKRRFEKLRDELSKADPSNTSKERQLGFVQKQIELENMSAQFQRLIDDLTSFEREVKDTLINDVHRMRIKNDFRSTVGGYWMVTFLLIFGTMLYLLYAGKLNSRDSSSLQLIAMVIIVMVVLLFGLTEVMGENGVTGLLASIAGYILGKAATAAENRNDNAPGSRSETNGILALLDTATIRIGSAKSKISELEQELQSDVVASDPGTLLATKEKLASANAELHEATADFDSLVKSLKMMNR